MSYRAADAVAAVLPAGARVEVVSREDPDVLLSIAGQEVRLRWLQAGWPRQAGEALARRPRPDVIAAPRLSPGARDLARAQRVGWVDETGSAEIASGLLVVSRTGDAAVRPRAQPRWRPATLAVCEALLTGCPATVAGVAGATGLAASTVAGSLRILADERLLTAEAARGRRSGREVRDAGALLEKYADAAGQLRPSLSLRAGVAWRDPLAGAAEAGRAWSAAGVSWAVTSALSAAVMAPFLTRVVPLEIYLAGRTHGDLRRLAALAGLGELDGGRLLLRPFPTPAGGTLTSEIEPGVVSVPWPRAYADLRVSGVRGEDAAEHLREVVMSGA